MDPEKAYCGKRIGPEQVAGKFDDQPERVSVQLYFRIAKKAGANALRLMWFFQTGTDDQTDFWREMLVHCTLRRVLNHTRCQSLGVPRRRFCVIFLSQSDLKATQISDAIPCRR